VEGHKRMRGTYMYNTALALGNYEVDVYENTITKLILDK
jgi:hypothetical protein